MPTKTRTARYAVVGLEVIEIIGLATVVAGYHEVALMVANGKVTLADLLLMFLYLEVLTIATSGKSRDGLLSDLDAKAADRIAAAVAAGKLTQAQADQLTPKVDAAIVKIVDHKGSPRPTAAGGTTTKSARPTKPTN